jgi:hypothetical protein
MLRYQIAVTDEPQDFLIGGDPVHVAASRHNVVEFWAEGDLDPVLGCIGEGWRRRTLQVFGTGHPLPHQAIWVGTADRTREGLVWHLYELLTASAV